jgi:hypothetical protein
LQGNVQIEISLNLLNKDKKFKMKSPEKKKDRKLTRRQAMNRMGISAFSAASMMLLLNKPVSGFDGESPDIPPDWP